ncbi:hypothetical protein ACA910_006817 [Epithemia clementina (nom. ined.)]
MLVNQIQSPLTLDCAYRIIGANNEPWTATSTDEEQSTSSLTRTTASSNFGDNRPTPINWRRRVVEKRKWLKHIQSSLPQDVIRKPRKYASRRKLLTKICREVANATADSWVIHSLPGIHNRNQSLSSSSSSPHHHRHAIIVPYRDRAYHLERFLEYMSLYLKYHYQRDNGDDDHSKSIHHHQLHTFALYIIEQADDELFNRALLMNVGLDHVALETECVIQHDVDLVPSFFAPVPYHNCTLPTHLAGRSQTYNFHLYYPSYLGAALTMHQQHWAAINGMDNQMQGWGAEDDELYVRLTFLGLTNCSATNTTDPKNPTRGVPYRPIDPNAQIFTAIQSPQGGGQHSPHHKRGNMSEEAKTVNWNRHIRHRKTGLSPSVNSMGGWRQSKYHIVARETWDISQNQSFYGGFAEIHHIQVKVNKSALVKCFINCNE